MDSIAWIDFPHCFSHFFPWFLVHYLTQFPVISVHFHAYIIQITPVIERHLIGATDGDIEHVGERH
jgi:hypothetical protein